MFTRYHIDLEAVCLRFWWKVVHTINIHPSYSLTKHCICLAPDRTAFTTWGHRADRRGASQVSKIFCQQITPDTALLHRDIITYTLVICEASANYLALKVLFFPHLILLCGKVKGFLLIFCSVCIRLGFCALLD